MNIWVAASDGDQERVRSLVESGTSPNQFDDNFYSPMHAAASYGHIQVLEYLISQGGDVNLADADGDTPLYTVENIPTAQFLVEHGAIIDRQNAEGVSPIDHLSEDFPSVAGYLRTLSPSSPSVVPPSSTDPSSALPTNHYAQNLASEALTSSLLASLQNIQGDPNNPNSGFDGTEDPNDPEVDAEIRRAVGRSVIQSVIAGYQLGTLGDQANPGNSSAPRNDRDDREDGAKRARHE